MATAIRAFGVYTGALIGALIAVVAVLGTVYSWIGPSWDVDTYSRAIKYPALLISAGLLAWWARRLGMTAAALGVAGRFRATGRETLLWFVCATVLLLPLWIALVAFGGRDFAEIGTKLLTRLPVYLLAAVAVSVLEELYFRGLLLSGIPSRRATRIASRAVVPVLAGALFYALLHMFDPQAAAIDRWDGGLLLLRDSWPTDGAVWLAAMPRLALLFSIGLLLGVLRVRTGRLAPCIGVHAAMVFSVKTFQRATESGDAAPAWLGADPYGGWAAAVWVTVLLAAALAVRSPLPGTSRNS